MTVSGFLEMVSRNPYLVLLRIHGGRSDERFTIVRIPDRVKMELSASEIRAAECDAMKRRLMGCWMEHWWTREFV